MAAIGCIIGIVLVVLLIPFLIYRVIPFLMTRARDRVRAVFGKGEIDISIPKTNYAPGDTICGNVALTLKKPVRAKELSISLIGQYETTQTTPRVGLCPFGKMGEVTQYTDFKTTPKTVRICAFKQLLDGEVEYGRDREYPFQIKIQADVSTSQIIKWCLLAKLDIPGGLDISKKVDITIG